MSDLKTAQAELKATVARIEAKLDAILPHLATKADLVGVESRLDSRLNTMQATLTQFATKADLSVLQTRLDTTLPFLATKADLADKPGKTYMWGILAALLTAYACGLAALAVLK